MDSGQERGGENRRTIEGRTDVAGEVICEGNKVKQPNMLKVENDGNCMKNNSKATKQLF